MPETVTGVFFFDFFLDLRENVYMSVKGKREFCKVCNKTTMMRGRALSLTSNVALWVYFILGFLLIGRLRSLEEFENIASLLTVIYIGSIVVFAAYDSFIKTLHYRCKICGYEKHASIEESSRLSKLLIVAASVFFALLLISSATFLIYVYLFI